MASIEVYDQTNRRWVTYVPDYKKWEQHFADVKDGRVLPDHKARIIVGSGARWRSEIPKVELVTPVAQLYGAYIVYLGVIYEHGLLFCSQTCCILE